MINICAAARWRPLLVCLSCLALAALSACGPLNTDLHPLPTYRVLVTGVTAPAPAPGGSEVTISAVWDAGGAPFQVTWGFPADFERVLVTESTTERSASVRIHIPEGSTEANWLCDVTVADGSPYRSTRQFSLGRTAAP